MSCEIAVNARLLTLDGLTEFLVFQDDAAGVEMAANLPEPQWTESTIRASGVYVHGSAPASLPTRVDGFIPASLRVRGATWSEVKQNMAALNSKWNLHDRFLLRSEVEGVTTTYVAEREAWQPEPVTAEVIKALQQEVTLVFRVQPNPVEVYA